MAGRSLLILSAFVLSQSNLISQEALKSQLPPAEIVKIVDTPSTPSVSVSPDNCKILVIERAELITIEVPLLLECHGASSRRVNIYTC